jgi:hypothetical protein
VIGRREGDAHALPTRPARTRCEVRVKHKTHGRTVRGRAVRRRLRGLRACACTAARASSLVGDRSPQHKLGATGGAVTLRSTSLRSTVSREGRRWRRRTRTTSREHAFR